MPPEVSNDPDPTSQEAQMKLLEQIVGDLPAFKPGEDTGQGILAPEGQEANTFYQSFNPPQQAAPQPSNGQTAVSAPPPQPQPPAPQPASAPAQAQPSTSGQLYAGMYRSVPELESGYKASRDEARRLYEENVALKAAQLAAERIGGFRQPRDEPKPQPAAEIPVAFRGDQPVVPINDFRAEVIQAAQMAAREAVSGILTPMQQLGAANSSLRTSYPEFAQREAQFASWLGAHPDYQELIQMKPDVGLESAYLKFSRDTGAQQVTQATQTTLAAQQQVESARQQAAPAGNVAPSSRRPTEQESKWAELERLYKEGQQTGNFKPFQKARIQYALGDQFVNTLDRTTWGR